MFKMLHSYIVLFALISPHAVSIANDSKTKNTVPEPSSSVSSNSSIPRLSTCPVQTFDFVLPELQNNQIKVTSDSSLIADNKLAAFEGNVTISNSTSIIEADSASIEQQGGQIVAQGNVKYTDELIQVKSQSVEVLSDLKLLQMAQSDYKIRGLNGRGGAQILSISEQNGLLLEDVSFTTCPEQSEDWKIKASKISINQDKPFGEAYNTRFYVGDVPVFYLPYFAFPITTERQSGFLFPKFASSTRTGVEYEQPFYWNIAPNMDATISTRLMTNRGIQLKSEFRYLTKDHQGQIQLEYLPSDNDTAALDERYFYRFTHSGSLNENLHLSANISDLSDDNYFVDLGSDYYSEADAYLYQKIGLDYHSEKLYASFYVNDFTTLGDVASNYRAIPELKVTYNSSLNSYINYGVHSEFAFFENDDITLPNATRFHIEPSISVPYQKAWGELLAEISVLHTLYDQDLKRSNNSALKENISRTIPQARFYGNLIFEKDYSHASEQFLLTLEPQFQYLYTDFKQQSGIGLYDATPLLTTFRTLFRGQEFTGLDRINDNNQITIGATSRLMNQASTQILAISAGQIFYLEDAKLIDSTRQDDRSAFAAEIDWQVNQNWFLHSDIQLGTSTKKVERSSLSTEYRISDNKLIKINHRYIRELSNEKIDQIGITASWPLTEKWHWVGRYYRDLDNSRSIESYMGLEYESCCWAIRVTLRRNLATRFNDSGIRDLDEFDSGISLSFIFKGMGSSSNKSDMLNLGLFGNRQPFVIY